MKYVLLITYKQKPFPGTWNYTSKTPTPETQEIDTRDLAKKAKQLIQPIISISRPTCRDNNYLPLISYIIISSHPNSTTH